MRKWSHKKEKASKERNNNDLIFSDDDSSLLNNLVGTWRSRMIQAYKIISTLIHRLVAHVWDVSVPQDSISSFHVAVLQMRIGHCKWEQWHTPRLSWFLTVLGSHGGALDGNLHGRLLWTHVTFYMCKTSVTGMNSRHSKTKTSHSRSWSSTHTLFNRKYSLANKLTMSNTRVESMQCLYSIVISMCTLADLHRS
jgi:hypothetical protein